MWDDPPLLVPFGICITIPTLQIVYLLSTSLKTVGVQIEYNIVDKYCEYFSSVNITSCHTPHHLDFHTVGGWWSCIGKELCTACKAFLCYLNVALNINNQHKKNIKSFFWHIFGVKIFMISSQLNKHEIISTHIIIMFNRPGVAGAVLQTPLK